MDRVFSSLSEGFQVTYRKLVTRSVASVVTLLAAAAAVSAPPVTTIDDTLYKADGAPFQGVLMINWRSFEGPGASNIPTNSLTVQVKAGRLYVKLVPTTTSAVAAYYSVRYVSSGSVQFTELWSVPPSETALRVRDIRIAWPPVPSSIIDTLTDPTIDDIEGLADELDKRPTKGVTFTPSRTAIVGPTGEIESASGNLSDCVRVDGTSGPCGSVGVVAGFVDGEAPSGLVDGVNSSFTLSGTPEPSSSLLLYRNGLLQKQGLDYNVAGNGIAFAAGAVPQPGDILLATYRVDVVLTSTLGLVDGETPSGAVDGFNTVFQLAGTPNPGNSLLLYRNGILQKRDVDYTSSGNTLTFLAVSIPQAGDILLASYRVNGQ